MTGPGEDNSFVGGLDDAPEIHHRDAVADMLDHREVVRDEKIGQPRSAAGPSAGDHLGLDRYVERRYRLVADDQPWIERQRARDADALALAAGKTGAGSCSSAARDSPTRSNNCATPPSHALPLARRCVRSGSPTMSPTVMRG